MQSDDHDGFFALAWFIAILVFIVLAWCFIGWLLWRLVEWVTAQ